MSVDQSQLNIEDNNAHQSVKSENDLYSDADIPLLNSVKQEVTICHDDSDQLFHIDKYVLIHNKICTFNFDQVISVFLLF